MIHGVRKDGCVGENLPVRNVNCSPHVPEPITAGQWIRVLGNWSRLENSLLARTRMKLLVPSMALTLTTACFSSGHKVTPSPRVATVMVDGVETYTRDGQTFARLGDAVRSNADATAAARTYERRSRLGAWVAGLSGACAVTLGSLAAADVGRRTKQISAASAVGCVLGIGAGIYVGNSGRPYKDDAINIYNDGLPMSLTVRQSPSNSSDVVVRDMPSGLLPSPLHAEPSRTQ